MGEILHWFKAAKLHQAASLADVNYHVFIEANGWAPSGLVTWDIALKYKL